jgi:rod shape-determining protein MreB
MFGLTRGIGIDLGTASVLIYIKGKGVVLREPSVIAVEKESNKILAVGEQARRMIGRTPGNIVAIRPMRDGVIADYKVTEVMLKHHISNACGRRRLFKPEVVVGVPSGGTSVERLAVLEAATAAGARNIYLIEEPVAAAIGAGLDIMEPSGSMVVDIGGGTCDIAVISLGGIVASESLRVAGDNFDEAITRHIKRVYNLTIGERTAEDIKIELGTAYPDVEEKAMEIRGRDMVSGLPRTLPLSSNEVYQALYEPVRLIVDGVRSVLERTPPELAADIMDRGMVMTGGGALLRGFDLLLSQETGIPVHIAENPTHCVVLGAGRVLENPMKMSKEVFVAIKKTT